MKKELKDGAKTKGIKKYAIWALKIFLFLSLSVFVFILFSFIFIEWNSDGSSDYAGGTVLRDDAGNIIRVSLGKDDVDCRPFYTADRDDWIVKALVASEDGEFWNHCGVRPLSVARAAFQNIFYRRRISGASTITMQTVRLIKPHPKTMWWKWKEAVMAVKMESAKSKIWILSQYLNRAPFGANFVGIEAAAHGWFAKGVKDLGIGEAAMLAGMVQAPSRFRPDRNYEKAFRRRDYVLQRMEKLGFITEEQRLAARSVKPVVSRSPRPFKYPYYCDYVLAALGKDRDAQRKSADIVTPLNADIQKIVEGAVESAAADGGYSVAAVVMKANTGEILSLHCSGNYFGGADGQVNTAVAPRPAGSTLKPFLAALAMDLGHIAPETKLLDAPVSVKGYNPVNFDAEYRGPVSLADSLVLSLNIPFVRMLKDIGVVRFTDKLRELGFRNLNSYKEESGLGTAIGNVEVSLVELVSAYGVIARGGDGVFSSGTCYLISDILSGTERSGASLGHIADVQTSKFAWKTGTSSAYRDAWTVAWNPEYVIGVWCGHKIGGFGDKTLVGAKAAAPVCWKIARLLYPQNSGPWFTKPEDIVSRRICSLSGMAASADCPDQVDGTAVKGITLPKLCDMHRRDPAGNLITGFKDCPESAFRIMSPENGSKFKFIEGSLKQRIVFRVKGNAGKKLWWFVNGNPVSETRGDNPYIMEMAPGEFTVTAVDEKGGVQTVKVSVLN